MDHRRCQITSGRHCLEMGQEKMKGKINIGTEVVSAKSFDNEKKCKSKTSFGTKGVARAQERLPELSLEHAACEPVIENSPRIGWLIQCSVSQLQLEHTRKCKVLTKIRCASHHFMVGRTDRRRAKARMTRTKQKSTSMLRIPHENIYISCRSNKRARRSQRHSIFSHLDKSPDQISVHKGPWPK
jgi:hypothetical protein